MAREDLKAQLDEFGRHPNNAELFLRLRRSLKAASRSAELATVCELRAPLERDPSRSASLWGEAGEARVAADESDRGAENFCKAIEADPHNDRAASQMVKILLAGDHFAAAADIMELSLSLLPPDSHGVDGQSDMRPADRHRQLGELWENQLGRLDRALFHYERAWELEPTRPEAIDAARRVHQSLGRTDTVAQLFQAELDALGERAPRQRRIVLWRELGKLEAKRANNTVAIAALERALSLKSDDSETMESLAQLYAMAHVSLADQSIATERSGVGDREQTRAVDLYLELAKRKQQDGDVDAAIGFLQCALGVHPNSDEVAAALESAYTSAERWQDLDRHFRQRIETSVAEEEVSALMTKRAELLLVRLGDRTEAKRCYEAMMTREPPRGPSSKKLRELYTEDGDWNEFIALASRELELPWRSEGERVMELLNLATVLKEHAGKRERAAEFLHQVLSVDPLNEEALTRYYQHFREKRDWRGLADLSEFAVGAAMHAGTEADDIVVRLEDLAQTCELRLGDVERATASWNRVLELKPDYAKAKDALRRLESRMRMWESLIAVLEKEAAEAQGTDARADALRRSAQLFRERQVDPRRAIALYEESLELVPGHVAALKALGDLYEREGDIEGLASTLRRKLEADAANMAQNTVASGDDGPDPSKWPTAMRVERLTTLRRLATMYEMRLEDVEGVIYACGAILELLPGDRDAMQRMERTLEEAGDWERLEESLEYHAEVATGPAERGKVYRRLANIAQMRGDDTLATERWERTMQVSPNDEKALVTLSALYERIGRHEELAKVLERRISKQKPARTGSIEAAEQAFMLKQYAQIVDQQLGDPDRAQKAWTDVLNILPRDREALEALGRLYEDAQDWRNLVDILKRQADVLGEVDPETAAGVSLTCAKMSEKKLNAPNEAMDALNNLIAKFDPCSMEAHERLQRLQRAGGHFEAAVRTLERKNSLFDNDIERVTCMLEIGDVCRDLLGDSRRALQAYERVLAKEPGHGEALNAAADLYAQVGNWAKHSQSLETLAAQAPEGPPRRDLYLQIAQTMGGKLERTKDAFDWYLKAYDHLPDETSLQALHNAAKEYDLWQEFAEVYERERRRASTGSLQDYLKACRELAAICERRLNDRLRAIGVFRDAIAAAPDEHELVTEAERLAQEEDGQTVWETLLSIYAGVVMHKNGPVEKIVLYKKRAELREKRLGDAAGAINEMARAFALAPDDETIQSETLRLVEKTGNWRAMFSMQAALFRRAEGVEDQIAIVCETARLAEEKADDKVSAFRAYLRAFTLDSESQEVDEHLWRLAKTIGAYGRGEEKEQDAGEGGVARDGGGVEIAETIAPRGESTQEIAVDDIIFEPSAEKTMELSVDDVTVQADRNEKTIELGAGDLEAKEVAATPPALPRPAPPSLPDAKPRHAPPAPKSRPSSSDLGDQSQGFSSAWEELAQCYVGLANRAEERDATLAWLYRAAEVWEDGANDIDRAFHMLATALTVAPREEEPRSRLDRLAKDHNAWDKLAGLYEAAAEQANNAQAAATLFSEVADVRIKQGNTQQAEAILQRILGMDPDNLTVRSTLQNLHREQGNWSELAASLEERTDPRLGMAAPQQERPRLLRELAMVYSDKLNKPYEAASAAERLRKLEPEEIQTFELLVELYGKVGRWAKVIEALGQIVDLTDENSRARSAQRRIAEIYAEEMEFPDRAVEAYENLLARWPQEEDVYVRLDGLLEKLGRWAQLASVVRRRIALTSDSVERAKLLQRLAAVQLDKLNDASEAVACLHRARALCADDQSLVDDLITALPKAGNVLEAVSLIEERLENLEESEAEDAVPLLLSLANLRAQELEDPDGAKKALDQAALLEPDRTDVLAALARLAKKGDDPSAYAKALLKEAEAMQDVTDKVVALLEAGKTLRDDVEDRDAARAAFRKVLDLEPANAEATWALSSLIARGGQIGDAIKLHEGRLQKNISDDERARILTELAALAQHGESADESTRRLNEALQAVPDYVPAVVAKADLLRKDERYQDLVDFLSGVVERLANADAQLVVELSRRLADAHDELGDSEKAYECLVKADRLKRDNLLTKLALGENRYRAKQWHEAALHFTALIEHPDAPTRAQEVASGLFHGAESETRSLRPDRAVALYEAALTLKADFVPALKALADVERERGNTDRAADLVERQAGAVEDEAERRRLFENLGNMALEQVEDTTRAKTFFEKALRAAGALEQEHIPLLRKLLGAQARAEDAAGVGRTHEALAGLFGDEDEIIEHLLQGAASFAIADQGNNAARLVRRVLELRPTDKEALWIGSEVFSRQKDWDTLAGTIGPALVAWESRSEGSEEDDDGELVEPFQIDEDERERRAVFWRRLGDAHRHRGETDEATFAYERSIKIVSDSVDTNLARRGWLAMFREEDDSLDMRINLLRELVNAEQKSAEVLELARCLSSDTTAGLVDEDGGRVTLELAQALGEKLDDQDLAYLDRHPVRQLASDEGYRGVLDEDDHRELVEDEDESPLAAALAAVWESASVLYSENSQALEDMNVGAARRVPPAAKGLAVSIFSPVTKALAGPSLVVYSCKDDDVADLTLAAVSPPILVLGPRMPTSKSDDRDDTADAVEIRFRLGRAVELARPERALAFGLPLRKFHELLAGLIRAFGKAGQPLPTGIEEVVAEAQADRLRDVLPLKARRRIEPLLQDASDEQLDAKRFRRACERAADRAGLLMSGDIATAMRLVGGPESGRHLARLAIDARYFRARAKLGIGTQ